MKKSLKNVDFPVLLISLAIVLFVVGYLAMFPAEGTAMANVLFGGITENLGSGFLWFGFLSLIAIIILATTKYGEIRLRKKEQFEHMDKVVRSTLHGFKVEMVNI